jgi:predicted peroxiredoxin
LYNADTDLLFHPHAIPALAEVRGGPWRDLVKAAVESGPDSPEQMTLILMMARLNSCATCNSDSFRAMNGCTTCAKQSIKRFRGTDEELADLYQTTKSEVLQYLNNQFHR